MENSIKWLAYIHSHPTISKVENSYLNLNKYKKTSSGKVGEIDLSIKSNFLPL